MQRVLIKIQTCFNLSLYASTTFNRVGQFGQIYALSRLSHRFRPDLGHKRWKNTFEIYCVNNLELRKLPKISFTLTSSSKTGIFQGRRKIPPKQFLFYFLLS